MEASLWHSGQILRSFLVKQCLIYEQNTLKAPPPSSKSFSAAAHLQVLCVCVVSLFRSSIQLRTHAELEIRWSLFAHHWSVASCSAPSQLICRETPGNSHQPRGFIYAPIPSSKHNIVTASAIVRLVCVNHSHSSSQSEVATRAWRFTNIWASFLHSKDGLMSNDIEICVLSGFAKPAFKNNSPIASIPYALFQMLSRVAVTIH